MKPLAIRLLILLAALAAFLPARAQTLGDALNAPELTWTTSSTGGASGWTGETTTTHDGVSAAASGLVWNSSTTSTLQTTVTGPGTITFWWQNQSMGQATLSFIANGVVQASTSYQLWQQQTFYLGEGTQTLKWVYSASTSNGMRAYVDQVNYAPGTTAPIILSQPPGESQTPGLDTMFTVTAGGTPPLSYQWRFNGEPISDATNSSLIVSNVQSARLGDYSVLVTNIAGSLLSSNAPLGFGQVTAWGTTYTPGWATVTNGATNILAVAAGIFHSLALKADGTVIGWAGNTYGETAVPSDLTNVVAIAAAGVASLALKADGTVVAWGDANFNPATAVTNVPPDLTNVVALAPGDYHCVALKADGTLTAWGSIPFGATTTPPSGLTNVVAIASGAFHSLALKADGTVVAWGYWFAGVTNVPAGLSNVVAVAGGSFQSLALKSDGTVAAWGYNGHGESTVPTELSNVVAMAAGNQYSLALRADGTVVAWGVYIDGETNAPTGLTNVVAVTGGQDHSLALVGDGPPVQTAPMSNPILSSDGFSVWVPTQSGRVYALEYKTSLSDAAWTALPLVAGNGTNVVLRDPSATSGQRFYRVRRW